MSDSIATAPPVQPQQPKKKHTVRNVLLVIFVLMIAAFAGCAALINGAVESADKALTAEQANDTPTVIAEGKAFEHDIWAVKSGWAVQESQFGTTIKGVQAELTGKTADVPMLTFTLDKENRVLASIDCTGPKAQPGQVVRLNSCIADGKIKGVYDTVTVADTF